MMAMTLINDALEENMPESIMAQEAVWQERSQGDNLEDMMN